jgi:soluble lytic murein transglycosylase-like protein
MANYTQAQLQQMISLAAQQAGIPASLALAVAQTESSFNPNAVSPVNNNGTQDYGIFQISSSNFSNLGLTPTSALDPTTNIQAGVDMLAQLYNQYNGNLSNVLWAYNAGPGAVSAGNLPSSTASYIDTVNSNLVQWQTEFPDDTSSLDLSGSDTISLFGYDVPLNLAIAGGIGLAALLLFAVRR